MSDDLPGFEERVVAVLAEQGARPVSSAFIRLLLLLVKEDPFLLVRLEDCPGPERVRCAHCPIHDEPGAVPPGGPCRISDLSWAVQEFRDEVESGLPDAEAPNAVCLHG